MLLLLLLLLARYSLWSEPELHRLVCTGHLGELAGKVVIHSNLGLLLHHHWRLLSSCTEAHVVLHLHLLHLLGLSIV